MLDTEVIVEHNRPHRYLGLAAGVLLAGVVACTALVCLAPLSLRPASSSPGVTMCAGLVTAGPTQVGVWWQALYMSRLLPATLSPYAACANIPWSNALPPVGEIAFPP